MMGPWFTPKIGETYPAKLHGEARTITILEKGEFDRGLEWLIRWDDGEEEWAYQQDLENWVDVRLL